ncbi:mesoderm induction early response protein 1 isoform X2 [Scaptodrosophila lebanonensis]|uniref:Mesoderm induction early response protein 1 isoform X2 n=1 Tax=Drosophila lebanonensis TaxID=7225 RepID=A0A6J2TJ95_DROLE|nr:mesoderm induction early response protein 1 isoform X2 [Scaptodrosophila lebanonensis]
MVIRCLGEEGKDPEESSRNMEFGKSSDQSLHSASETSVDSNSLLNSELAVGRDNTPTKRERRKSPATSFGSDNTSTSVQPPMSPTSSLADITFEPTIDMMVNDFDDEATLNEEEALADLEAHNPEDEIATLREESEMPIEELLAKYSGITDVEMPQLPTYSSRRAGSSRRKRQHQEVEENRAIAEVQKSEPSQPSGSGGEHCIDLTIAQHQVVDVGELSNLTSVSAHFNDVLLETDEMPAILPPEVEKKHHRSHLLDLYPDESFGENTQALNSLDVLENFTPLQNLFGDVEPEEDEDSDTDSDDARKIIMVGPDYQAEIPEGLSQYGDILPYENEDQLIWEPSQVSERAVEDYLTKIQETKSTAPTEDSLTQGAGEVDELNVDEVATAVIPSSTAIQHGGTASNEIESVVKDNEQALHLLVQCGYDFKEALRRKRLNVMPLCSDAMSSWSEDECQKFEEGIQKFGKDFYQIRQNQVRTRTMRELVQFYYLWKKSERRDQSFALNDTIDHMDVFINEGGDRAGNGNGNGSCSSHGSSNSSNGHGNGNGNGEYIQDGVTIRKSTSKSYSIMTGNNNNAATASTANRKRKGSFALEDDEIEDECTLADN